MLVVKNLNRVWFVYKEEENRIYFFEKTLGIQTAKCRMFAMGSDKHVEVVEVIERYEGVTTVKINKLHHIRCIQDNKGDMLYHGYCNIQLLKM